MAQIVGVVNSTPLIALSQVGQFDLLPALFDEILIPASVYGEVVLQGRGRPGAKEIAQAEWLIVKKLETVSPLPPELLGLDQGELDVILLAQEVKADWVLIIVTPLTFIASAGCAVLQGAVPVFADVDRDSQNIHIESIRKVLSSKTKAVIVVHLAGWPCDMDAIMDLARQRDLKVIEVRTT